MAELGDRALELLDVQRMRGLEIGPLYRPRIKKSEGDVRYVDYYSTEELRRRYEANEDVRRHLDEIVDVDYVVKEDTSLSATVGPDGPFDYIIASHVIEHIANPLGWLHEVSSVLTDSGLVSLVIPDRRFSFDVNRPETRPQDWIDWFLRDLQRPSYAQIFDFFAHATTINGGVDTPGIWAGTADYTNARREDVPDADIAAYEMCLQSHNGLYLDVHSGIYTPRSFVSLLEVSMRLQLLEFEIAAITSTPRDSLEFYVTLRRCQPDPERQLVTVGRALEILDAAPMPDSSALILSQREQEMIELKRKVMRLVRRAMPYLSSRTR